MLVLLPGLICDGAIHAPQTAAFGDSLAIQGYGMADSIGAMADSVLEQVPAEFDLMGHSMGGRVALELMRLAPQRVERLALLDTGTHPLAAGEAGEKERAGRMALLKVAQTQGMRALAQEWAKGMVHPDRIGGPVFDEVLAMFDRGSAAQYAAQIHALLTRPDAAPLLSIASHAEAIRSYYSRILLPEKITQ